MPGLFDEFFVKFEEVLET